VFVAAVAATGCGGTAKPAPKPSIPAPAAGAGERFGPGVFSTDAWDFFIAFSPDQRRALFGRADDKFERYSLLETRRGADGAWSPPTTPRFAAGWSTADPHIAPDGKTVYFISNRPDAGETAPRATYDVFAAALGPDGEWGDARRLPPPVNGVAADHWSPSVAANGSIYFGADLPGGAGGSDLWVSRLVDGAYQPPENLGPAINTAAHEVEPWIAPDESYLIVAGLRRPDGVGGYDLFLSRRGADGRFAAATLIGGGLNTAGSEWNHSVSPDGAWLYFTRTPVGGKGDIYRIPMETIMTTTGPGYAATYEITSPARIVYVSGQVPETDDGVIPPTFAEQCRLAWANVEAALAGAGMTTRDLVKVTTFLSDRAYRAENARIRREVLGDHLPALTIIIAGIYDPAWLLEIEAVAARPLGP
jgi:enamine deaminase RidA (YjgF/YER057c/UK114 family)